MKVLLVNPARYAKDTYIFPPIHLLYIAQAIRRTGHEAEIVINLDLNSKEYYAALATPYPGSPSFQQVVDKGIIKDTRDYLLNLGGYADYRYNLTGMPRQKFLNKVDDIANSLDLAYYKKRKKYPKIFRLMVEKHLIRIYHVVFPADVRMKLNLSSR